jgi:hypothetical protein
MQSFPRLRSSQAIAGITLLSLPLVVYGWFLFQRPPRIDLERPLFPGIYYRREVRFSPRPVMIHLVRIDLTAPGIRALVTPGTPGNDGQEINARTTSTFLRQFNLQLAVNASFFNHFREKTPWDYYPRAGERVNAIGQAISNQIPYSPALPNWAVLCLAPDQRARILEGGVCPDGTAQAVAGNTVFVRQGQPVPVPPDWKDADRPYARVAVATDRGGQTLWLIVVDGKQPFYSEGMTMAELTRLAIDLGANSAINLDGGGSTTLVMQNQTGATILNAPIHTKLPLRERPVANHLGFYVYFSDRRLRSSAGFN